MSNVSAPPYDPGISDMPEPSPRFRRSRIVRFVVMISAILLASCWFVGTTWAHFTGGNVWVATLVPSLLTMSFIPATIAGRRFEHPLLRPLTLVTSTAVGLLSFAVFAALASWIAAGFVLSHASQSEFRTIAFWLYGIAAAAGLYGIVNAAWIRTTRVVATLPGLPPSWEGRTAAVVTDIHVGNVRSKRFVERIVRKLNALKPTAVLISGDMFDGSLLDHADMANPWSQIRVPMGTYFVTGNHDEYANRPSVIAAMLGAGIRVLDNERVSLQGLQLVGVHDEEASNPERLRSILKSVRLDRDKASILLTHQPANLAIAEEAGISLQASGHTHAGQFWPWSLIVSRVWGPFGYGLNRHGKMQVLTSSGVGTWGPPLRVGTRSEIVLIEFRSVKP